MTILMKLLICIVLIAGTGPESDGCRLKTVTVPERRSETCNCRL